MDQYIESVPTAKGPKRVGGGGGGRAQLPPEVRRRLREQGGADARGLEAVATAEALGAPDGRRRDGRGTPGGAEAPATFDEKGAVEAVADAAVGDGAGSTGLLLGGLLLTSAMVGTAAIARRRRAGT